MLFFVGISLRVDIFSQRVKTGVMASHAHTHTHTHTQNGAKVLNYLWSSSKERERKNDSEWFISTKLQKHQHQKN